MLKDSLKWMIITLTALVMIAGGVFLIVFALSGEAEAPVPSAPPAAATDTPLPTATPTPSPVPTPAPADLPAATDAPDAMRARAQEILSGMTLEQKVGQLVMFGFSGTTAPSDAFAKLHQTYQVGNYILYGANVQSGDSDGGFDRTARLTYALNTQNASGIPPLISIDVEGGSVVRFRWSPWPSSARTLGRRDDPDEARTQFLSIGRALRDVGINMNLAPVLDVAQDPMSTFLKTRIISSDAEIASRIGAAIIEGLADANCLSTAKHFPGHGGTNADSHESTPVVSRSAEELTSYDLVPFQAAVDAGVDVVLVGHLSFPALDSSDIATQSSIIITDLLRTSMGFTGIVMSDDFRMAGLTSRYEPGAAAVRFLLSGGDLILCGAQAERQTLILDALLAAARDGTLPESRIDESVTRILLKKLAVCDW